MARMSIIGPTSIVIGDVSGRGDLEIVGRVQGDVAVDGSVTVAPDGVVLGSIRAQEVRVAGRVDGNVAAKDSLSLQAGANVSGDLVAARLGIEEGARVRGSVRTEGAELDEAEDEDVIAPSEVPADVPGEAPGGQERRRRDRRRRRSHAGNGGAPTPTLPLGPHPPPGSIAKNLPPSSAGPSSASPAEPVSPRPPQPAAAGRPGPPAPVVPALAKGVRGRRRPSSGQD